MRMRTTFIALFVILTAIAAAADTEPPVVSNPTASPSVLSPPNGALVPVTVSIGVRDDVDPRPRCAVRTVWSNQDITQNDWRITGDLKVELRASVSDGRDRQYGVVIVCTDAAGNEAGDAAIVHVPAPVVPTDDPPVLVRLAATPDVLSPPNDAMVPVKIEVQAVDDVDKEVRCAIRTVWSNQDITQNDWKITGDREVLLRASATGDRDREYGVVVVCTDSAGNEAGDGAIVRVPARAVKTDDPPVLVKLAASPDVLSPPKGELVPVKIDVEATDDIDKEVRCGIRTVWSNQTLADGDFKITGDREVALRATANDRQDRHYGVVVVCTDSAGNEAGDAAIVRVPAAGSGDQPPVITRLAASPDVLSPPNGERVAVKIGIEATDDVDPQPRCTIRDVLANQTLADGDAKITGDREVTLRATATDGQDREYGVVVVCADSAGNETSDVAMVRVPAAVDHPPTLVKLAASPDVLTPANGELVAVKIELEAVDDIDPQPRCTITNVFANQPLADGDAKITGDREVALRATAAGGQDREYGVVVVCTDSGGNETSDAATVRVPAPPPPSDDPPVLTKLTATPNVLSPPNGELMPVKIEVAATDDKDQEVRCAIRTVWSNQAITEDDWKIAGDREVALRASTSGGQDREYGVVVVCTDSSGNEAGDAAMVRVPAPVVETDDPPVLVKLAASPDVLSPANGELMPVKIEVAATDDVDREVRCAIRTVWSNQDITDDDWKITGDLEVALRARASDDRDREYGVVVVCTDSAGNEAGDAAIVRVRAEPKPADDPPVLMKLTASPDLLTPANDQMVPVKLAVDVVDDLDPRPRCAVTTVWSDQQISDRDWRITGELEVELRASTSGGQARSYSVVVVCTDYSGNAAGDAVTVRVPVTGSQPSTSPPPTKRRSTRS